jgi:3-oxoacyl-[acyl-carrier protein] reductase
VSSIGPYAGTKAAIEAFSFTLAQELGGRGITVNTIHPGPIETDVSTPSHTLPHAH